MHPTFWEHRRERDQNFLGLLEKIHGGVGVCQMRKNTTRMELQHEQVGWGRVEQVGMAFGRVAGATGGLV